MLIKFKKPDPRAGMTARMDSSRGQQLVDAGCAEVVPEGGVVVSATTGITILGAAQSSEKMLLPPDDSAQNPEPEPEPEPAVTAKPARGKK